MKSRLKRALDEAGETQTGLARALGVSRITVHRWATDAGVLMMTMRQAERVARALGCKVSDLYEEGGE